MSAGYFLMGFVMEKRTSLDRYPQSWNHFRPGLGCVVDDRDIDCQPTQQANRFGKWRQMALLDALDRTGCGCASGSSVNSINPFQSSDTRNKAGEGQDETGWD